MSKQQTTEEIRRETEQLIARVEAGRVARVRPQAPAPQRKIKVTAKRKRQADPGFKNVNPGDLAIANLFIYDLWWDKMTEDRQIFYQCNGVALERDFEAYLQTLPEPARRCIERVITK